MVHGKESHGYILLGYSVVGFRGSLELGSVIEREHEALLRRLTQYEMSLIEEDHMYRDQSLVAYVVESSNSKGATTVAKRLSVEC